MKADLTFNFDLGGALAFSFGGGDLSTVSLSGFCGRGDRHNIHGGAWTTPGRHLPWIVPFRMELYSTSPTERRESESSETS
jgi:hypothetical protein